MQQQNTIQNTAATATGHDHRNTTRKLCLLTKARAALKFPPLWSLVAGGWWLVARL
jgi:hypothetical protein